MTSGGSATELPGKAGTPSESTVLKFAPGWPSGGPPVNVQVRGFATVSWCSTEATLWADEPHHDVAAQAVVAFQECYQRVKALQQTLVAMEHQAAADVSLCYCISTKDRKQWPRLRAVMHQLASNRLDIVRLQSSLGSGFVDQAPEAAKLGRKLIKATRLKAQLAELSDRHEALEDLYEGAVDRINDHGYWRDGHLLEVAIIVVLLVEFALLLF